MNVDEEEVNVHHFDGALAPQQSLARKHKVTPSEMTAAHTVCVTTAKLASCVMCHMPA